MSVQIAQASLRTAQQARAELGSGVWSRVLRIDNSNPHNGYPSTVFATVFEFDGILWFYTDANGTQSFSLHRGRLDEEKANFTSLVQAISPDFRFFEILPEVAGKPVHVTSARLPNGCFIDSLAALRYRIEAGDAILRASLLSVYVGRGATLHGHTVLAYETPAGAFLIDSAVSPEPVRLAGATLAHDPIRAAQAVMKNVTRALWLPVVAPKRDPSSLMAAMTPSERQPATGAGFEN